MTFITNGKKIIATDGERKVILSQTDGRITISGDVIVNELEINLAYKKGLSLVKVAEITLLDDRIRRNAKNNTYTNADGFSIRINGILQAH